MVDIFIKKNNGKVSYLRARGHAGYDTYGKDIVCSAISSIITGGFNALNDLDKFDISLNSGEALLLSKSFFHSVPIPSLHYQQIQD